MILAIINIVLNVLTCYTLIQVDLILLNVLLEYIGHIILYLELKKSNNAVEATLNVLWYLLIFFFQINAYITTIYIRLVTIVKGNPKAPFSIATT